jgi:tRNA 2-selenouridine synthase
MRSEAIAWILQLAGFQVAVLTGGYKAFRQWVRQAFEQKRSIAILGGMTGSGKTEVLHELAAQGAQVLDLEALAHHRGSSYGNINLPAQPTNEQFENEVAIRWVAANPAQPLWIEAESKRIGLCRVPESLFQQMEKAPVYEIVRSRAERIARLVDVYGTVEPETLVAATERIRKRLGGLRTQQAIELIRAGQLAAACDLILAYYDKTYTYDLQRRSAVVYPVEVFEQSAADSARMLIDQWKKHQIYS